LAVLLLLLSPVFIWNQSRHWPTLRHLLWHVGVSEPGAVAPVAKTTVTARLWWPVEMGLSQLGVIGPLFALAWLAVARPRALNGREQLARRYWLCGALPILAFYLGVSFFTEVNANWPIAGAVALLGLVSQAGDRAPERWLWKVGVAYGLAAWVLILFPLALTTIPGISPRLPVHRITGARSFAVRVETVRQRTAPALIVAANYGPAARLAYYLPDQPAVCCARSWLGGAHTAYDYFADTNLADPRWRGRDVLLVGGNEQRWRRALRFEQWEAVPGEPSLWIGRRYGGPAHP
jgi:hypothetical protein